MRRRIYLLQRQSDESPRSMRWYRLLTAKFLGGITLAGIILYTADAISQNALGQLGMSIIQSLFMQIHVITTVTWLYVIIAFLILIIICLIIGFIRQKYMYSRLMREMQQKNYIAQVDEHVLNQLSHLMNPDEEGESNES